MHDSCASPFLPQLSLVFWQFAFVQMVGSSPLFILDSSGSASGRRLVVTPSVQRAVTGVAVLMIATPAVTVVKITPSFPFAAPVRHGPTTVGSDAISASHGIEILHVQALLTD